MTNTPPIDISGYLAEVRQATSEADIESAVSYMLKDFMRDQHVKISQQVTLQTSKQRVDILMGSTLIEVKKNNLLGRDLDSARKQVAQYLLHLSDNGKNLNWKGLLTNGMVWHSFILEKTLKISVAGHFDLSENPSQSEFYNWLRNEIDNYQDLAPPPRELSKFLDEPFDRIKSVLMENTIDYPLGITIKKTLWYNLLSAGHVVTDRNDMELFATHTLLVLVAKIVCKSKELRKMLSQGELNANALGYIAGDGFTSWLLDVQDSDQSRAIVTELVGLIMAFDWNATEQDILKVLYHDLIPNKVRHEFGEFYTPDWLAKKLVDEMMPRKWCVEQLNAALQYFRTNDRSFMNGKGMLDPACGSGTFLFHAAKRFLKYADKGWDDALKADLVSQLVIGIDIHPIAVEMAKATLLTALPELPTEGESALRIFMGDSLMSWSDDVLGKNNGLEIEAWDGLVLHFPEETFNHFGEVLNELMTVSGRDKINEKTLRSILTTYEFKSERTVEVLVGTANVLWTLKQRNADHIWKWYAENLYNIADLRKRKVGMICANPPWVVYNSMAPGRQSLFRDLCKSRDLWQGKEVATQHDLASLFSASAVDYFLPPGQKFTFVLPYSALRGKQWQKFRTGQWGNEASRVVVDFVPSPWDLSYTNAFPTKSCVIFGKRLSRARSPVSVPESVLLHQDDQGNVIFKEAEKGFPILPSAAYQNEFMNGATLVPHCLLLPSELKEGEKKSRIIKMKRSSKGDWKEVEFAGNFLVESGHIARVTLSRVILPFIVGKAIPVLLPLMKNDLQISHDESTYHGNLFRQYWAAATDKWNKIANKDRKGISFFKQIDYHSKLSRQLAAAHSARTVKSKVIYTANGDNFMAARVAGKTLVDKTLYWAIFPTSDEAAYVTGILNAPCLQKAIKDSRQSDRDFMAWPLKSIPIPKFNSRNTKHIELAELCKAAERNAGRMRIDKIRRNADLVIEKLTQAGFMDKIDSTVRILLPEHTT